MVVGGGRATIKMTTETNGDFGFALGGSGLAMVDFGDGSENVALTHKEGEFITM